MKPSDWRGADAVSARFSRVMNATTSPLGLLADPPLVALVTAVLALGWLLAKGREASEGLVTALGALACVPVAVAVLVTASLLGARRGVVAWLDATPFPVENVNALLNGVGEVLEVRFDRDPPAERELNERLERVHPDVFVTATRPEERVIELRIGVVDDKRLSSRSNHARWVRVRRIVDEALRDLDGSAGVAEVRVR